MTVARVLIIEDELLARRRIRRLLARRDDVEVVGEAKTAAAAAQAIRRSRPDLAFVDIRLPDGDSLEMLRGLERDLLPVVIFATAYDQYAIEAFEIHALDYLLKPFDDERFEDALARGLAQVHQRQGGDLHDRLTRLLGSGDHPSRSPEDPAAPDRLVVRSAGRIVFLPLSDLVWVEAQSNYCRLHTADRKHLIRESMHRLEARLPPERFLRIHRSTLVRIDRVREIRQARDGHCYVVLDEDLELRVSESRKRELMTRLGLREESF